jgi:DNA-directed RNA polymerase subunit RPC12/RpoP
MVKEYNVYEMTFKCRNCGKIFTLEIPKGNSAVTTMMGKVRIVHNLDYVWEILSNDNFVECPNCESTFISKYPKMKVI